MSQPYQDRLKALRNQLSTLGVDAVLVQRTDHHGSEYLPDCEQRIAWLTGFTGSAATFAVTQNAAAVFSDGRYTVQLAEEVDEALFERCHSINDPPRKWLERNLGDGCSLGYDPMLTKKTELEALSKAAERGGWTLKAIENPIDSIWTDRPAPPRAMVQKLSEDYAGVTSIKKRADLGDKIKSSGADALLVTATDHIAWLLNVRGNDIPFNPLCLSYLIASADGSCRWFVDANKLPSGLQLDNAIQVEPYESLFPAFEDFAGQKILFDPASTHIGFKDQLLKAGAEVIEGDDPITLAKAAKNTIEIEGAIQAQRRDGAAMVRFLLWLDQIKLDGSLSEMDAAERLHAERQKDPLFQGPSFDTISAHGPNAALPHYRVSKQSNRPLTGETVYLVDSGGQYLDGTTDITRTVALGDVPGEIKQRNTLVLKGHIKLATVRFPKGTTGAQLDTLARYHLWKAGLDFDHGTGHGVGAYLCVHEGPQRISKAGTVALVPGMIISNEPGYYKSDHYGIRIENLVIVERAGKIEGGERELYQFNTITLCPLDRNLIDTDLLDASERAWLNAYHVRVREELADLLSDSEKAWLESQTQAI